MKKNLEQSICKIGTFLAVIAAAILLYKMLVTDCQAQNKWFVDDGKISYLARDYNSNAIVYITTDGENVGFVICDDTPKDPIFDGIAAVITYRTPFGIVSKYRGDNAFLDGICFLNENNIMSFLNQSGVWNYEMVVYYNDNIGNVLTRKLNFDVDFENLKYLLDLTIR